MDEIRHQLPVQVPSPGRTSLPDRYGIDRLVLMPRDPYRAFAYWEVTDAAIIEAASAAGLAESADCPLVLEILALHGKKKSRPILEMEVDSPLGCCYLQTGGPDSTLVARLGLKRTDGKLHVILESNSITLPRNTYAEEEAPHWRPLETVYETLLPVEADLEPDPDRPHRESMSSPMSW